MTFSRRTPLYHKAIQLVHSNVNIAIKPPLAMIADDTDNQIQFQSFHSGWYLPSHPAA